MLILLLGFDFVAVWLGISMVIGCTFNSMVLVDDMYIDVTII